MVAEMVHRIIIYKWPVQVILILSYLVELTECEETDILKYPCRASNPPASYSEYNVRKVLNIHMNEIYKKLTTIK